MLLPPRFFNDSCCCSAVAIILFCVMVVNVNRFQWFINKDFHLAYIRTISRVRQVEAIERLKARGASFIESDLRKAMGNPDIIEGFQSNGTEQNRLLYWYLDSDEFSHNFLAVEFISESKFEIYRIHVLVKDHATWQEYVRFSNRVNELPRS